VKVFCLLLAALLMPVEVFSWSGCATNAFVNEVRRFEEIGNTANLLRGKEDYPPHKLRKLLSPVIRISNEKTGYVTTYFPGYKAPVYHAYFSDDRGFVSTGYEPAGIAASGNLRGVSFEFDITNNLRLITLKTVEIGISFTEVPDSSSTFILKERLYPGRKMHIRWFAETSGRRPESLVPEIRSLSVIPGDIKDSVEPYESGIEEYDSRYCR